ncbi:MAG TPA: NrsF family protein [Hyphomicrobiaceae bacterium]
MNTNELITRLTADLKPVRPLRPPWARAGLWLGLALPCVAALVWGKLNVDASLVMSDARFMVEEAATLATALTAAIAAFASAIPGFDRRILLLPLPSLSLWLASVGHGCLQDWIRLGADGLAIRPDWDCLLLATMIGVVPAAAMITMLRAAPPLRPRSTLALAALAVASLANFGLQFAHVHDASIMVLTWHLGAAAVFSALGGSLGERILGPPDRMPAR